MRACESQHTNVLLHNSDALCHECDHTDGSTAGSIAGQALLI